LSYHTGALYPQDAASQVPVQLLAPQPGEVIIDACAAPGSKTTQIALAMAGQGVVIASDAAANRRQVLAEVLARQGVVNGVVTPMALPRLATRLGGVADGVLVDAPCSGHVVRTSKQVSVMARKQQKILQQAATLVRPGGRLVYSTCTPYLAENEGVVQRFLADSPDFSIEPIALPEVDSDWLALGGVRLYPHRQGTEPFFALRLRRQAAASVAPAEAALFGDEPASDPCPWSDDLPEWTWQVKGERLLAMSPAAAAVALPSEARGLLVARRRGSAWQPTPWGAQALLAAGITAQVQVTAAEALTLWTGSVLAGYTTSDGLVSLDDGQPLGFLRQGRLNLPAAAFRTLVGV
jgi:precorrin-6B methylase 2